MMKKFRLMPLAIILMSLVLGVKIVDFSFGTADAIGQEMGSEQKPSGDEKEEGRALEGNEGAAVENASPILSGIPTRKEIEYLQKLGERRQELARRASEMDDREKLLEVVEKRIVERTASLKKIKETIEALLAKHDKIEKAQLDSLVKMYSSMKPKDAAGIFDSLDSDVLISIVENMKESKMGAILAKMNINKAKKLTTDLAVRKKLPKIDG